MENEAGEKGNFPDKIIVFEIRRKLGEKKEEYSGKMNEILTQRRDQSAADFWNSQGKYGSMVAVVDKAEWDLYIAEQEGEDPAVVERLRRSVDQLPRDARLASLGNNWIGSCMGEDVGGEINPATGLPKWAERAMSVKPSTAGSPSVTQ